MTFEIHKVKGQPHIDMIILYILAVIQCQEAQEQQLDWCTEA